MGIVDMQVLKLEQDHQGPSDLGSFPLLIII
jgi:hypothetical protein